MMSISTTLSGVISHTGLFLLASCETLGKPLAGFRGTLVEKHWLTSYEP